MSASPVFSLAAQRGVLRGWLICTDAIALGAAFLAAYWVRFDLQVTVAPEVMPITPLYQTLAACLTPLSILVLCGLPAVRPGSAPRRRVRVLAHLQRLQHEHDDRRRGHVPPAGVRGLADVGVVGVDVLLLAGGAEPLRLPAPGLSAADARLLPVACGHHRHQRGGRHAGVGVERLAVVRGSRRRLRVDDAGARGSLRECRCSARSATSGRSSRSTGSRM